MYHFIITSPGDFVKRNDRKGLFEITITPGFIADRLCFPNEKNQVRLCFRPFPQTLGDMRGILFLQGAHIQ
jgi:hypothetical protein